MERKTVTNLLNILNRNVRNGDFEILCSDFLNNETGDPVYSGGILYEDDDSDLKIGLFGMDTPETQTKSLPGNFKDMHFATDDEFYRIAQNEAVENHFLYEVSEDSYSDENVRDAAQKYIDDTDRMYSEKIAECTVSFNGHTGDEANSGKRNSETNIGDLVADAFIWYIRHQGTVTGVPDRNVIAIMNGAGIRKAIPEGDITRKDIRRVTIDSVNGEAFDPEADYMLLLPSFLADGGDTYYVLTEASERIDTGITIQYAVTEYIMDALDGLIDESYSEPKGRIHILK